LNRADQTDFGEKKEGGEGKEGSEGGDKKADDPGEAKERKKKDPLRPLPMPWLLLYRIFYFVGLGISGMFAQKLDESVENRAKRRIDHERIPVVRRFFGANDVPLDASGEPVMATQPADTVLEHSRDEDGLRIIGDNVVRYDDYILLRPLRRLKHTILDDWAVWQAQASVMFWFFITAILTLESTHSMKPFTLIFFNDILTLAGGTKRLEDFIKCITAFTSFFLGLFMSLTLARWQRIWDDGVMRIFRGTEKLCIMLATDLPERMSITTDPTQPPREVDRDTVVSTFSRWSSAVVVMLFERYGRNAPKEEMLDICQRKGLINDEERGCLDQVEDSHPIMLQAWQFKIIYNNAKDTGGPGSIPTQPYHIIHNEMMFGVTNVMETLRQPLPFSYISLISMFVKFMNLTISSTGGILVSRALMHHSETEAFFDFMFVFVVTLLTHSVVILNLYLANPLKDHFTSFCLDDVVARLERSAKAAQAACGLSPSLTRNKWEKKT
jgi:hypothetical protein